MLETAVVVGTHMNPIHWHLPEGRTSVAIPDTVDLWDVIWEHRKGVLGVAHSHPGGGVPSPSMEDLTTFSAIERGIGRRLLWWIISEDRVCAFRWIGPEPLRYGWWEVQNTAELGSWLPKLMDLSYGGG